MQNMAVVTAPWNVSPALLAQAMLSLFELATMDNWQDFMHTGMDSAGIDNQPVTDRSAAFSLFFVVFISVVAFFMARAFVGVFIKQVRRTTEVSLGGGGGGVGRSILAVPATC